jgi:hypothetical protein
LAAGVVNYYLFRPGILLFRLIPANPAGVHLSSKTLQLFFSGYFSDMTWCIALCLTTGVLEDFKLLHMPTRNLILVLPFVLEAGQYYKIIPGTFDWIDIALYATIVLIFSLLPVKKSSHEKS